MKFAIDIGHNAPPRDTGAVGLVSEDRLTKLVGEKLTEILKASGHQVILTAPRVASSVNESLGMRVKIANQSSANLFVSIHFNAANFKAHGAEVYALSSTGGAIARSVLTEICKLGYYNRGVKSAPFYVLRHTTMPAILVECCFCDSKRDMDRFDHNDMARAIATGLIGELPDRGDSQLRTLRVTVDGTWLKPSTEQSSSIPIEQKEWIVRGKYQLSSAQPSEEHHHLIKTADGKQWFIYAPHCTIS